MAIITTPNGYTLDDGGRRVVVDPVTRIEGHLRLEVNVDQDNVIRNAVSTGTMWRGLEVILRGRDPRDAWAFVQRICGVCTGVHALASVRAVEKALAIDIPENANTIRNIMHLQQHVHDHLVHFYHLHALDWVDVLSALNADPRETSRIATSISAWPKSSPGYFSDLQGRLKKFVESGQLGPFTNGYWGHPAYKLPADVNLLAVAHYLEALDFQRVIGQVHTVFGGKNPHPNWLVGGVPCPINLHDTGAVGAINMERLNRVKRIIDESITFVEQVYIPDVVAIAGFYKDWGAIGGGLSNRFVLSYGDIPQRAGSYAPEFLDMPAGAIIDGDLSRVHPVSLMDLEQIQEWVTHSWYSYPDESVGIHPFEGITEPNFVLGAGTKGSKTDIQEVDESAKYSFIKAPRWRGHAMEVGPLARYVIGYVQGKPEFKEPVDKLLTDLEVPFEAIFSTLGRTAARALETAWAARKMRDYYDRLINTIRAGDVSTANVEKWAPETWPQVTSGCGFVEAPRGALGHWVTIENTKIKNYQAVVPTTWNGSPRDHAGNIGAYEASLLDTPMADPEQPLEILRTVHSFDPCLACSTHVMTGDGREVARVRVR